VTQSIFSLADDVDGAEWDLLCCWLIVIIPNQFPSNFSPEMFDVTNEKHEHKATEAPCQGHFKKMRDNKKIFFISLLPSDQSDVLSYLTSLDNIKDDKEEFESCFFFFIYTDPLRLIDRSYFLLPIPNH
jgi:hypothetical protein